MITAITNEVKVSVEIAYQKGSPGNYAQEHMFAYRITIQNLGDTTVKLLRRHWYIVDTLDKREVEGEGVVGLQPVLEPNETHQYVSGCNLKSEFGKMYGTYLFERVVDGLLFKVAIPEFSMVVPYKHS